MAESPFNLGKYSKPSSARPGRSDTSIPARPGKPVPKAPSMQISCRATNPLSLQDDLEKVFLDENQAKATTATRLFRNNELFNATKKVTNDFLAASRGGMFSMWSTGCSSGEEVYSMAMISLGEFDKAKRPVNMEAFGTDINRNRIMEAREGVYLKPSKDSMSQNYWMLLNKYAEVAQSEVSMGPVLRKCCKFTLFDMRNKPKKHTFHFIVCNHVLQYYDAPGQRHIISNLIAVLKPGGTLYLEGVTDHGLDGLPLEKVAGSPNMYKVGEPKQDKGIRGLTRRFFKKP